MTFSFIACSGPILYELQEKSQCFGNYAAAIGGVAMVALVFDSIRARKIIPWTIAAIILFAIHPAWTLPGVTGSCATPRVTGSKIVTLVFLILLFGQFFTSRMRSLKM